MPLLTIRTHPPAFESQVYERSPASTSESEFPVNHIFRPGLIGQCANPVCRSSWMHLFRNRSTPVFEEGWTCSPECTEARLLLALRRELDGRATASEMYHHRMTLGLLMLEHGWITRQQLRGALQAQEAAGSGRLGEWLIEQHATDEMTLTRALALQWSCPVLSLESQDPAALTSVMPRLFLDAFGALPLRVAAGKLLYVGFEQSLDPVLAFAIGRMTGLRIESGIMSSSLFRPAHCRMLKEDFPPVQLAEAVSELAAAHLLACSVERFQPSRSRLVRVRDCVWMRMWLSREVEPIPRIRSISDVVCSIGEI